MTGDVTIYATGRCQCGAVRFRVTQPLGRLAICHCRMCQRATGNVFAPLVHAVGVEFDGEPARFASSDVADRGFCRDCGTPLFCDGRCGQGLNLMVGTLENPNQMVPELHYGVESRVSWLHLSDEWPEYESRPSGLSGRGPKVITSRQSPVKETR